MNKLNSNWLDTAERIGTTGVKVTTKDGEVIKLRNVSDKKLNAFTSSLSAGRFFNFSLRSAEHRVSA